MNTQRVFFVSVLSAAMALALPAFAQTGTTNTVPVPDRGTNLPSGSVLNGHFNTAEADGRPGAKFFVQGNRALQNDDYQHAIYMFKLAAYWGYHPAEYDLGIMYYKGHGVTADHARGAAWMILAAQNGNPRFTRSQDLMVTALSDAEFKRADQIWNQLKPKYGNKATLRRAEKQWHRAKTAMTGSRLGHATGELLVGGGTGAPGRPANLSTGLGVPIATTGAGAIGGGIITDGSVAYRQFTQSRNPYDPIFLKPRTGKATVGPLQQVKPSQSDQKKSKSGAQPPASSDSKNGHFDL